MPPKLVPTVSTATVTSLSTASSDSVTSASADTKNSSGWLLSIAAASLRPAKPPVAQTVAPCLKSTPPGDDSGLLGHAYAQGAGRIDRLADVVRLAAGHAGCIPRDERGERCRDPRHGVGGVTGEVEHLIDVHLELVQAELGGHGGDPVVERDV